ncbi:MAG: multidrug effflux MFS transporter [Rhodobacteraceae bacterium]|nr:multidrug effflux MFS transporter [Paracoccaceae bacterium]
MAAILFATLAFSIDAMLPALPQIAAELSPEAENRAQLVILSFMFGMGLGTLIAGPISDAVGRKPVILFGMGIFIIGAIMAILAQDLTMLLVARLVQGLGAACPRIVTLAMTRDLFEGRRMAQITSFIMTIFMIVPAVAPSIGVLIIDLAGWRAIFVAFIVFSLIGGSWLSLRQPETLAVQDRRPLRINTLATAAGEVLRNKVVMIYTAAMTLGTAQMMGLITSTQPIYADVYGKADSFPLWFAASAVIAGSGTVLNAYLVTRVGMRRLVVIAFGTQFAMAAGFLALLQFGMVPAWAAFPLWFFWSVSVFFTVGLTFGNLTALALQPMGHIAGLASSVIAALSTIFGVILAIPIGQSFNGTPVPLLIATALCSFLAWQLMRSTVEPVAED